MAERIFKGAAGTSIIFMSAYSDKEYLESRYQTEGFGICGKPLDMEELASAVKEAGQQQERENKPGSSKASGKGTAGPSESPAVPAWGGKSYEGRTAGSGPGSFYHPYHLLLLHYH